MEPRLIRIVHYGLGGIGSAIARLTTAQRGLEVIGGIDHDPAKVGRDLGDVIGLDRRLDTVVSDNATELLLRTHPDVVIHATTSLFHQVYSQILDCVAARANVISTCEELVYPYTKAAAASEELNRLAMLNGVTVLGAGVNPGFVMDLLPLLLTAPCMDIKRISVARLIDATERRASVLGRSIYTAEQVLAGDGDVAALVDGQMHRRENPAQQPLFALAAMLLGELDEECRGGVESAGHQPGDTERQLRVLLELLPRLVDDPHR